MAGKVPVNGKEYALLKLLEKGRGGYSLISAIRVHARLANFLFFGFFWFMIIFLG